MRVITMEKIIFILNSLVTYHTLTEPELSNPGKKSLSFPIGRILMNLRTPPETSQRLIMHSRNLAEFE